MIVVYKNIKTTLGIDINYNRTEIATTDLKAFKSSFRNHSILNQILIVIRMYSTSCKDCLNLNRRICIWQTNKKGMKKADWRCETSQSRKGIDKQIFFVSIRDWQKCVWEDQTHWKKIII